MGGWGVECKLGRGETRLPVCIGLKKFEGVGHTWGFPKIRGTILGVPVMRAIVFWGLYRVPLIFGNYHIFGAEDLALCVPA